MRKCIKLILIPMIFLCLIQIVLSIKADNLDFRYDYGYITFNESISGNERGYGNYIAGLWENLLARLGILEYDVTGPQVNLIYPTTNIREMDITFQYNFTDANKVKNCSVNIDNELRTTNTTPSKAMNTFAFSLLDGDHNWFVNCTDVYSNVGNSNILDFAVSKAPPGGEAVTGIGALSYRLDYICNITYNFILTYSKNYTEEQLNLLFEQTNKDLGFYINKRTLETHINKFEDICEDFITRGENITEKLTVSPISLLPTLKRRKTLIEDVVFTVIALGIVSVIVYKRWRKALPYKEYKKLKGELKEIDETIK